jgi:hypothetical protein
MEGGEIRKILRLVEDERGFYPAIGHEEIASELRQRRSVLGHIYLVFIGYTLRFIDSKL